MEKQRGGSWAWCACQADLCEILASLISKASSRPTVATGRPTHIPKKQIYSKQPPKKTESFLQDYGSLLYILNSNLSPISHPFYHLKRVQQIIIFQSMSTLIQFTPSNSYLL